MERPPTRRAHCRSTAARATETPKERSDPRPRPPLCRGCRRHLPYIRPELPLDGPAGQQPAAGQGQRLAGELPPIGEVLWGHGAPELSAGDPAILHNACLQPPEVGLPHDGPAVAHQPRRELLARHRWRTAESSRLGVPDARASWTPTRTRRQKPGMADTRGRSSSSRDVAGDPFFTACSMSWYIRGALGTGGSGCRGSAARIREMKYGSVVGSPGCTGAWRCERSRGRPAWPQCSSCAWRSSSSWKASGVSGKQTPSGLTSVTR